MLLTVFGAAIGWFLSQNAILASENASLIRSHIIDLEDYTETIQNYWLCEPSSKTEEMRLAAMVKSRHAAIAAFYGEAARRLSIQQTQNYQVLQLRLYKVTTGGAFETANRKIDPIRAIEAYQISAELIHLLRLSSKEQASILRFLTRSRLVQFIRQ